MKTIGEIELKDQNVYPDEVVLKGVLGGSYSAYLELVEIYDNNLLTHEWRYYRDGNAWLCKVQHKKRTIVWMSAWKGYMKATLYIPEKYIEKTYELDISESTRKTMKEAKYVGKSKAYVFAIKNKKILKDLEIVMKFKMMAK